MNYIEQLTPQMNDYNKLSLSWLPNLMFFNQPNFRSKTVNTDSYGFRYNNSTDLNTVKDLLFFKLNQEKDKNNYLILGGSTSFGVGATSDKNTISSLIEKKTNFNFINCAGRALNGFQEIILLLSHLHNIKNISKIIIFSGINDFYLNKNFSNSFPGNIFQNKDFIESTKNFNLNTLDRIKKNIKNIARNNHIDKSLFPKIKLEEIIKRNFSIYQLLSRSLEIPIIYILQPNIYWCKDYSEEEKKLLSQIQLNKHHKLVYKIKDMDFYEEYKLLLERISKSLSVEFHDSNKYFKENSNQNDWLFVDTLHLTDQGNAFVTKFVSDLI